MDLKNQEGNLSANTYVTSSFRGNATNLSSEGFYRHEQQIHQLAVSPGSRGPNARRFRRCSNLNQHFGRGSWRGRSRPSAGQSSEPPRRKPAAAHWQWHQEREVELAAGVQPGKARDQRAEP